MLHLQKITWHIVMKLAQSASNKRARTSYRDDEWIVQIRTLVNDFVHFIITITISHNFYMACTYPDCIFAVALRCYSLVISFSFFWIDAGSFQVYKFKYTHRTMRYDRWHNHNTKWHTKADAIIIFWVNKYINYKWHSLTLETHKTTIQPQW